jgi:hypothetical protein
MRTTTTTLLALCLAASTVACDLDVPNLNNPNLEDLENDPTPSRVSAAATGLLIGIRGGMSGGTGYVQQLAILGREAYNFDTADSRYIGELLVGELQPSSPFGGAHWGVPYNNIRLGDTVVKAAAKVPELGATDQAAIRGFALTIRALDLLRVITTRDSIGAVIETGLPIGELAPIVSRDEVYAEIGRLLDEAADELDAGGEAFPFTLHGGFAGLDTPATFRLFNRALKARVAVYLGDHAGALAALAESFLDDTAATLEALEVGAYHTYGTGTGDVTNGLTTPNLFAHPSWQTDAQDDGGTLDDRFTRKITESLMAGSGQGLTSNLKFQIYTSPSSPLPIIRNEELILLRAEARAGSGDLAGAIADLDLVRAVSGGLPPLDPGLDAAGVEDEIVYNRRYSLMLEGGHRWIDARRFGRMDEVPLDVDTDGINVRYPLPQAECDARPDEPACTISSR